MSGLNHFSKTNFKRIFAHNITTKNWKFRIIYLLQSHQASQQANFGRVRASLGFLRQRQLISDIWMYVCMYITDFASIPSNRSRGYFLFRVQSYVFAGEDVESK